MTSNNRLIHSLCSPSNYWNERKVPHKCTHNNIVSSKVAVLYKIEMFNSPLDG